MVFSDLLMKYLGADFEMGKAGLKLHLLLFLGNFIGPFCRAISQSRFDAYAFCCSFTLNSCAAQVKARTS